MVILAVDAMGGDHAPQEIVRGAAAALRACEDLKIFLVGRREQLTEILAGLDYPKERLELVHADEVIQGGDNPSLAVRRKRNSSMVAALQLVRSGQADAVLSAGNTGALMAGALLFLGRLPGVGRPALLAVMPGVGGLPLSYSTWAPTWMPGPSSWCSMPSWAASTPRSCWAAPPRA